MIVTITMLMPTNVSMVDNRKPKQVGNTLSDIYIERSFWDVTFQRSRLVSIFPYA
jgi:hypothetical protein